MCGGEATTRAFAWDPAQRDPAEPLRLTYGDQDFLKKDIEGAARALRDKGLDVNERVLPGAAHCAFDAHGEAVSVWSAAPVDRGSPDAAAIEGIAMVGRTRGAP